MRATLELCHISAVLKHSFASTHSLAATTMRSPDEASEMEGQVG